MHQLAANGHRDHRVTIRDISKRAGVALTTVSSALHGRGRVGEKQRLRIQQIAREMGYQPKLAAQMLRATTTGHVGLILPNSDPDQIIQGGHSGPILAQFIKACETRDRRYHVEFLKCGDSGEFLPPAQVAGGMVDGVLVGGYVGPELTAWLEASRVPWVSIDEPGPQCVLSADDEGVYQAVQKLAALGHRRIAIAVGPSAFETHRKALIGFRKAMQEFDLQTDPSLICIFDGMLAPRPKRLLDAVSWSEGLLRDKNRPSAVITHDMVWARGLIYQAMRMGIGVPEDLSVIAVGLPSDAEKALPCLSALEVNFGEIVDRALDLLHRCLEKRPFSQTTLTISPRLVMRDTVGLYRETQKTKT